MQQAICARSAVILAPHKSHKKLLGDVPFYIERKEDLEAILTNLTCQELADRKKESFKIARDVLDYRMLARRLTRED